MSEYGPGLSMSRTFGYDRERIQHAFKNELICDETESGFIYRKCTREEAEEYILSAFDNAVHQCMIANTSGRALENILRRHNIDPTSHKVFLEYMAALQEIMLEEKDKETEAPQ